MLLLFSVFFRIKLIPSVLLKITAADYDDDDDDDD